MSRAIGDRPGAVRSKVLPIVLAVVLGISSNARAVDHGEVGITALDETIAPGTRYGLLLATDGDGYLATWTDRRNWDASFATRIDRSGRVLDRVGIRLPLQYSRFLGWDGAAYIVTDGSVAVRVGRDGEIKDPQPRRIVPEDANPFGFASGDGYSIAVYWQGYAHVYASILDSDLETVHASITLPLAIAGGNAFPIGAAPLPDGDFLVLIASDAEGCLTGCPITAYHVSPASGLVTKQYTLAPSADVTGFTRYTIAVGSRGFTVATASFGSQKLTTRSWDFDGTPSGSAVLGQFPAASDQKAPQVVADGSGYVVTFTSTAGGHPVNLASRLDESGRWDGSLHTYHFDDALDRDETRIAWNGSGYLLGLRRLATLYGAYYGENFDVGVSDRWDEIARAAPLAYSPTPQGVVAIATNGGVQLALWFSGESSSGSSLRATRLSAYTGPLDSEGIAVDTVNSFGFGEGGFPAAVSPVPGGFAIAWLNGHSIYARRLGLSGTWIDNAPRLVDASACTFTRGGLGPSGAGLAVVYATCDPGQVLFRHIDLDGFSVGPARALGERLNGVHSPVIATDGTRHLVVWQYLPPYNCPFECAVPPSQLRASRVSEGGVPLGEPFDLTHEYDGTYDPPAAVWTGSNYLVAFDSRGLRIDPDGSLLDATGGEFLMDQFDFGGPAMTFDGEYAYLLWSRRSPDQTEQQVSILRVDPARPLRDQFLWGDPGSVASGYSPVISSPSVAIDAISRGHLSLFYSRIPIEQEYGSVSRAFYRSIELGGSRRAIRR